MTRYKIDRENEALVKLISHEARFGRPVNDRRVRQHAEPVHNALLQNAQDYPLKPASEALVAIASVAIAIMFVIVLIEMVVR